MGSGKDGHLHMYDTPSKKGLFKSMEDTDIGEFTILDRPPSPDLSHIDDLGPVEAGEGIFSMTIDKQNNIIYGLTHPGGKFFIYDIENRKVTIRNIFEEHILKEKNISRAIICSKGKVYFSGKYGYLIQYCPQEDSFKNTNLKIPVSAGKEYLNTISALAEADDGTIYGGTYADGYLFSFDPEKGKIINLGKPSSENSIRGITVGHDGIIWGLSGAEEELTHLFRYDPYIRGSADMGMIRAKIPKTWTLHEASVLTTGADGEIYIGESDAISHLFIYYPPIGKINFRI
jgi:outer membrane protein assembly factor BamB